jgi:ketosteroid isomerase-like protein
MTQSDAELLRIGYEDFAAGDVPAVLAVFSEDITWYAPGRNPISGVYTGHDEVLGLFRSLGERSAGTFHLDVQEIFDNGDGTVVVLTRELGERNGAQLDSSSVHVWKLRDGKVTSFQAFQHDDHAWDEFWA